MDEIGIEATCKRQLELPPPHPNGSERDLITSCKSLLLEMKENLTNRILVGRFACVCVCVRARARVVQLFLVLYFIFGLCALVFSVLLLLFSFCGQMGNIVISLRQTLACRRWYVSVDGDDNCNIYECFILSQFCVALCFVRFSTASAVRAHLQQHSIILIIFVAITISSFCVATECSYNRKFKHEAIQLICMRKMYNVQAGNFPPLVITLIGKTDGKSTIRHCMGPERLHHFHSISKHSEL